MKVISVENVSKKFMLAHDRPKSLADAARGVFSRDKREEFWALKGVSLDVEQGEAIGIIGHNGAGKSTMLKMLTSIMQPTSGRIRTRGRVSALIEVGAGFHPEMTGRENIYLNGSILGMPRKEIDSKFDEIVAFAELEKFIDTPVKRYSSGMYARLGFAVAAHVNPDILIVDEVLAVGDVAFQEKCSARMRMLRESGATVVFVSHNFGAITGLCDRVALLWKGELACVSSASEAISAYRDMLSQTSHSTRCEQQNVQGPQDGSSSPLLVNDIQLASGGLDWRVRAGGALELRVSLNARKKMVKPRIGVRFVNSAGTVVAHSSTALTNEASDVEGSAEVFFGVKHLPLLPGDYTVQILLADNLGVVVYDHGSTSRVLTVLPPEDRVETGAPQYGMVWLDAHWIWPSQRATEAERAHLC